MHAPVTELVSSLTRRVRVEEQGLSSMRAVGVFVVVGHRSLVNKVGSRTSSTAMHTDTHTRCS